MKHPDLGELATNAIRYWERMRIAYDLVLLVVVVAVFAFHFDALRQWWSLDMLLQLFLFAVLANVAYCAAYPVDLWVQCSAFRKTWRRVRWVLFVIGTVFAAIVARFMAQGLLHVAG
jgi:hypothetical protein